MPVQRLKHRGKVVLNFAAKDWREIIVQRSATSAAVCCEFHFGLLVPEKISPSDPAKTRKSGEACRIRRIQQPGFYHPSPDLCRES